MVGINADVTRSYYQPPDPVVSAHCDECGGEIYERSTYYELDDRKICEDCIDEAIINSFENLGFEERLELVGGRTRVAQEEEW